MMDLDELLMTEEEIAARNLMATVFEPSGTNEEEAMTEGGVVDSPCLHSEAYEYDTEFDGEVLPPDDVKDLNEKSEDHTIDQMTEANHKVTARLGNDEEDLDKMIDMVACHPEDITESDDKYYLGMDQESGDTENSDSIGHSTAALDSVVNAHGIIHKSESNLHHILGRCTEKIESLDDGCRLEQNDQDSSENVDNIQISESRTSRSHNSLRNGSPMPSEIKQVMPKDTLTEMGDEPLDYSFKTLGSSSEKRRTEDSEGDRSSVKVAKMVKESGDVAPEAGTAPTGGSQRKYKTIPSSSLREGDVGIKTYLGVQKGFTGIIKERYEDFVVHEISVANEVVHLTDFSCPQEETPKPFDVSEVLSDHDLQSLKTLQMSTDRNADHLIDVTHDNKESRTMIHTVIRENFNNLESNTVDVMSMKYIKVTKTAGGGSSRGSRWPKGRPKYCRFVLSKENIDTNECLALMAKYLRIRPHAFQYAGTKDKRAVTVQEMTIHRFEAERLEKLNKQLRGVRLGNFRYVDKPLSLGELSGNHFEIVLRDVKGIRSEIEKSLESLKENGFINYFGMQRFGNSTVPTHHIGRAVLKNQWEEAINLILQPRLGDEDYWRQHWMKTKDAKSTLERMPFSRRLGVEQQVLKSLAVTTNNFCQAFASIPRNSRMLYLHSYQSRIWNMVASKRVPKWGVFVNTGDLVARNSLNNDKTSWICPEKVEDETLHKFSFEDIVLPLPGHSVHFPENEASTYNEILAEDGLTMEHMKHKVKDYSLPGAYRKLLVKPTDVTWSFIKYDDAKEKLIQSDLDRMKGIPEPVPKHEGRQLALKIAFSLPTSAYATMALRELLKTETSASHHAALTLKNRNKEINTS